MLDPGISGTDSNARKTLHKEMGVGPSPRPVVIKKPLSCGRPGAINRNSALETVFQHEANAGIGITVDGKLAVVCSV